MVKQVTCGRSFVERKASDAGAVQGRDFVVRDVPGALPGTVVLRGTTLLGELFLSCLVAGA